MDETWWTLIKLIFALPVVIAAAIIILRFSCRSYKQHISARGSMEIVDRLTLNSRTSLYVINIQGDFFLLGNKEGSVVLLDKISDYQIPEKNHPPVSAFESVLGEKMIHVSRTLAGKINKVRGISKDDE